MLILRFVNVGNSRISARDSIVILTLIAWAAIVTSALMVSYDLQIKTWHSWLTFSIFNSVSLLSLREPIKNMRNQIISFLFIACLFISACSNDDDRDVRKVTDYKEYTLTVASKKLPGVVTSCGNSTLTDVYAVKNESQSEWQPLGNITKFDYEPGYEYQIRISATSYLDRNMGEPAWTEYKLLEVLSKERKDSKDLPVDFIPDWYEDD